MNFKGIRTNGCNCPDFFPERQVRVPVELEFTCSAQNRFITSIPSIPPISTSPMYLSTLTDAIQVNTVRRSSSIRSHLIMSLKIRQRQIEMLIHLENLKKLDHARVILALTLQTWVIRTFVWLIDWIYFRVYVYSCVILFRV